MRATGEQLVKTIGNLLLVRTVLHDNVGKFMPVDGHGTGLTVGRCSDNLTEREAR